MRRLVLDIGRNNSILDSQWREETIPAHHQLLSKYCKSSPELSLKSPCYVINFRYALLDSCTHLSSFDTGVESCGASVCPLSSGVGFAGAGSRYSFLASIFFAFSAARFGISRSS